jgi:hypothetical protein
MVTDRMTAAVRLVMLDNVWEPESSGCLQAFQEFDSPFVQCKQLFRCGVPQSVFGRARIFGLIRFRD